MVQIKRIKLGRRNTCNKCWQIMHKNKISIIKLCFLCSMLIIGIQLGLWISQFSMIVHDNAILASVVRNDNNGNFDHGISSDGERSSNHHVETDHKTDEAEPVPVPAPAPAPAPVPADVVVLYDDVVDDKLKHDVEQELVKQFVQWINYPFLQELKGSTTDDDDDETDDFILEHQDGDDHLFTKFKLKAKRSNLLLQEGIELIDEYNELKIVDTDIDPLLEEVDLTYNIIKKIISKLKQIVAYAEKNGDLLVDASAGGGAGRDGNSNNKFLGRHHDIARGQAQQQAQQDLNNIIDMARGQQQQARQALHNRKEKYYNVDIPDEDIRPLNEECNTKVSTINTIVFRGERHSGTKWIRSILEQNVKRSIYINQDDPKYGWKHGFLPPLGWGERIQTETVLLLVVTRDVFTWLPKMYHEAYDRPTNNYRIKNKLTFSQFIRTEYGALCHPLPGENREFYHERKERQEIFCMNTLLIDDDGIDGIDDKKMLFDIETTITERADNMIQIRTQKYKQWLSNELNDETFVGSNNKDEFNMNRVHINLESLYPNAYAKSNANANANAKADSNSNSNSNSNNEPTKEDIYKIQDHILGTQLDKHCIERMKDFQGISERGTFEGDVHRGGFSGGRGGGFGDGIGSRFMSKRYKRNKSNFDRDFDDVVDNLSNKYPKRQKRHGRRLLQEEKEKEKHRKKLGYDRNQFDGKIYDATREVEKLISMYTKEDIQFVLNQLDLDFERSIGYDYEYINDIVIE